MPRAASRARSRRSRAPAPRRPGSPRGGDGSAGVPRRGRRRCRSAGSSPRRRGSATSGLRAVQAVAVASSGWSNGITTPVATSQVRTANPPAARTARTPKGRGLRSRALVRSGRHRSPPGRVSSDPSGGWRHSGARRATAHTPTDGDDDTDSLQPRPRGRRREDRHVTDMRGRARRYGRTVCGRDTPAVMVDPVSTIDPAAPRTQDPLVIGPVLRYVGAHEATVWVETSRMACVEVRAGDAVGSEMTFAVAGHTYALVAHPWPPRRDRDAVRGPRRRGAGLARRHVRRIPRA